MKLQKPPLIRETSVNMSAWTRIKDVIYSKKSGNIYNDVILENELQSKLNVISEAILNRKNNNSYNRNILIHGPPGTGKTLWAKSLATQSGMD